VKDLQQEFPLFDFSAFKGVESTWMLTLLENHRKLTAQEIEANAHRSQDFLLEILKSNKGESYHEFQERIRQLKLKVRSTLESHPFADHKKSTVLVISHACVLNYLSAKTFNSEGKV
jgi:broad specificity phosphatase PhoE